MTYEGLRLKINKYKRVLFAKYRKKRLKTFDFTIISNNCWGGMVYESFGLKKCSPTVGVYFFANDYIKFLKNLKKYISLPLEFIEPAESKYFDVIKDDKRFGTYPIGKLQDIEIMFLHYSSKEEAKDKWERRCRRINWSNLIVKFNDQNGCNEEYIKQFSLLPYDKKLFFTIKEWPIEKWTGFCVIRQYTRDRYITTSHEPIGINPYINLIDFINDI